MNEQIITVSGAESLAALNKSEIDMQVATAKAYPRDVHKVLNNIVSIATLDQDTAADCFYSLLRSGSKIEGLSVRLAEIFAGAWGNLRAQSRIIANDGKTITAQGVCYDVENNVAISVEVKRKIVDRNGKTFSEDMQVVTGNAACSIAFRNAVFKVIPQAVTKNAVDEIKKVAVGMAKDLNTTRASVIKFFTAAGVPQSDLLEWLDINSVEEITNETVFTLRGLANALHSGETTVEESITTPLREKRKAALAAKEAKTNKEKIAQAIAKQDVKEGK